jgi:hypothetical protein
MKQNLQRSANLIGLSQPNTERQPIYKPKQPEVASEQAEFAKYACAFADDEYVCRIADSTDQAKQFIEFGFDYVTDIDEHKLFRKRK